MCVQDTALFELATQSPHAEALNESGFSNSCE
jgi:hypothetical protein